MAMGCSTHRAENSTVGVVGVDADSTAAISRVQDAPIQSADFDALAAASRESGLWLSAWTLRGEVHRADGDGPDFLAACWRWSRRWRGCLSNTVRAYADRLTASDGLASADAGAELTDFARLPGLSVWLIPIIVRRRPMGVLVALRLSQPVDDEVLRRFCDDFELDVQALRSQEPMGADSWSAAIASRALLVRALADRMEWRTGSQQIDSLVQNLAHTYEELNLVYRVSAELDLVRDPQELLQRVAEETRMVSRARSIAFLISNSLWPQLQTDESGRSASDPADGDGVRCFVVNGECPVGKADVQRVANAVLVGMTPTAPHCLVNDVPSRSDLAWAGSWLRHAVLLPLTQRQRCLGAMLAMNCVDEGDFTSVDVQLLRAVADRVAACVENQRLYDNLAEMMMSLLRVLINSIDAKDPYTCGHSERVGFLSRRIAELVGLGPIESQRAYLAGLLHDVGKIGVPDAILGKPGKLTDEEYSILKKHPEIGAQILSGIRQVQDLIPGVMFHHERYDGRGYPSGLRGDGIPRLARIICLADCLDAMTTTRTYRAFLPPPLALAEVRRCAGTQFDPEIASALLGIDVVGLLTHAHRFAGSRLPEVRNPLAPPDSDPESASARWQILSREMFVTQVQTW